MGLFSIAFSPLPFFKPAALAAELNQEGEISTMDIAI
jgi:hypothetical protein